MASNEQVNFWAIDNDGTSDINPGVWDGFTKQEKSKCSKVEWDAWLVRLLMFQQLLVRDQSS